MPKPLGQRFETRGISDRFDSYRAVRHIFHPPFNAKGLGCLSRVVSKEHPLHHTMNHRFEMLL